MIDWLLDTLLATSGLIVLVLLLREPVRRHFGARAAYALWLIPVSRLFMPTLTDTVERTAPVSPSNMVRNSGPALTCPAELRCTAPAFPIT